jgi:hypothetical protein
MITIEFDEQRSAYCAGDSITGTVTWRDLVDATNEMDVRLIWYTKGKGDRDVAVIAHQSIPISKRSGQRRFEFVAPNGPYSFSGRLISLIWAVEVVELPSKLAELFEIVVAPDAKEVVLHAVEEKP